MDVNSLLKKLDEPVLAGEEKIDIRQQLSQGVNHLLLHDFQQLLQLLYRIDVPEEKLRTVLKERPNEDAGDLIADLILQRQAEKKATKESVRFSMDDSDEEKWT